MQFEWINVINTDHKIQEFFFSWNSYFTFNARDDYKYCPNEMLVP